MASTPSAADLLRLGGEGGQAKGRRIGREQAARMGLESQDRPRQAIGAGHMSRLVDHGSVSKVDAIEITDGQGRTPDSRQVLEIMKDTHGRKKLSAPSPRIKGKGRAKPGDRARKGPRRLSFGSARTRFAVAVDHDRLGDHALGLQFDESLFGDQFGHRHPSHHRVTDPHRRLEAQVLRHVNASGTGKLGADGRRDEAGGQHAVGNSSFEHGFGSEFVVSGGPD